MKATPLKKMSALLALAAALTLLTKSFHADADFYPAVNNPFIQGLKEKLNAFNTHFPEDRVVLQTDKPMYEPGNDIWLSAWIRDGISLQPSTKSDLVTVELINPKGGVESKIKLIAKNGKANGDFALPSDLPGGLYKLRAYTNWMKNVSENNCFEKEIQIQEVILPNLKMQLDFSRKAYGAGDEVVATLSLQTNENKALANHAIRWFLQVEGKQVLQKAETSDQDGLKTIRFKLPAGLRKSDALLNVCIDYQGSTESIARAVPVILNNISLNFFPEGGDLLEGQSGRMAFKAMNEWGKAADIEGTLYTADHQKVLNFSSLHQGMGSFYFTPQKNQQYYATITKPAGISQTFVLPECLPRGYALNLQSVSANALQLRVLSTETEELALVAQVRGKMVYATALPVLPGSTTLAIPTADFPVGVTQLTLFDSKGIARAERLCFVNAHKQLNIKVVADKEKYLPREKVKLSITVKDDKGLPMPANLSMAVVNDQWLSFADDKSGHLVSQLLLQQDLREKVEEPAFYFNPAELKATEALDALMLTAGWRRFTWEEMSADELPNITHPGEKAIVAGQLLDAYTGKGVAGAKLTLPNGSFVVADQNGRFKFTKLNLVDPANVIISAEGYQNQGVLLNEYRDNLTFYLYSGLARFKTKTPVRFHEDNIPMAAMAINEGLAMEAAPVLKKVHKEVAAAENKQVQKPNKDTKAKHLQNFELVASAAIATKFDEAPADMEDLAPVVQGYYRARQFPSPTYSAQNDSNLVRNDFRNTIYWNPDIEIGHSGKKTVEFFMSDNITSFRITAEGIGSDGTVGRYEKTIFSQLPFTLLSKMPVEVAGEDLISIPVTLVNNSQNPIGGHLLVEAPDALQPLTKLTSAQTLMPGKAKTLFLQYKVLPKLGEQQFRIQFKGCGLEDAITTTIKVVAKGYPVKLSCSGQTEEKEIEFDVQHLVQGSLKASFTAFPNVVSDLLTGIDGILQEPYGCFEQTSCTAYPNAMVLDYLKNSGTENTKVLARATDLLDRGYKRLTTFETPNKGYEWFGSSPAHEGLTAYGIMEFVDMKKAGQPVDMTMLDRTARWLLNHRDGKGGFEREKRALHDFGRISDEVMNAYIVYALSDAGYTDLRKEFETSCNQALNSKDAYQLAMMANAALPMKDPSKQKELLRVLMAQQKKDGSFVGANHSITYSQGQSLTIETTALAVLAILQSPEKNTMALQQAVEFLVNARQGSGTFSSTQGTILALKALTAYAVYNKRASEDGLIQIFIDGKKCRELTYKAGDRDPLIAETLEKEIKGEGKHRVRIKYLGVKNPLPFSLSVNWNTTLPQSDDQCQVNLQTKLSNAQVAIGETVRYNITVTNTKIAEVPSTIALIGIPAGCSLQPWQLKALQEKGEFDYYEIKGNTLALYYRGLAMGAVKHIHLDLKAELAGTYESPASCAYLYYTNEFKCWSPGQSLQILQPSTPQ